MAGPFQDTLGAVFIGGLIATALFGVTCTQAFHYYQENPKDLWYLKTLVGFVLLCDVAHMILTAQGLYWYLIVNFSNPNVVASNSSSFTASILVTSISDAAIRVLFTRRIWILSRGSYALTLPPIFLTVITFVAGTGVFVTGALATTYEKAASQFWLYRTNLALMVTSDFYNAICLCFLLHGSRSANGIGRTNSIIRNLIMYVISTGLITGITSIFSLIMSIVFPATFIWIAIHLPLSKLYCNAMLAMLNARKSLRSPSTGAVSSEQDIEISASSRVGDIRFDTFPLTNVNGPQNNYSGCSSFSSKAAGPPVIEVHVDNEVHISSWMFITE